MLDVEKVYDRILSIKGDKKIFVETGTAVGETSLWASKNFDQVITIELMDDLYDSCMQRFWDIDNIKLIYGDSAKWIDIIFDNIKTPAVWFLDAHNVNRDDGIVPPIETPILDEIRKIVYSRSECIIIDDLRLFGEAPGYPCVEEIKAIVEDRQYDFKVIPEEDLMIAIGTIEFEGK